MDQSLSRMRAADVTEREIGMFLLKEKEREVISLSEVKEKPIRWLWKPYLAFGKVSVIHGVSDSGKSMFASYLMAACTNRVSFCDMETLPPCNVLYFSGDDDLSDRIRPRLARAGADLIRVFAVHDLLPFTLADESIEQLILNFGIEVMIVDPIQEYLEHDVYEDQPEMVYPIINKLEGIAKRTGCAMVLMAYSDGPGGEGSDVWKGNFIEKVSSVLCIDRPVFGSLERTMLQERNILAPEGAPVTFYLDGRDLSKKTEERQEPERG